MYTRMSPRTLVAFTGAMAFTAALARTQAARAGSN
jgi:hypothetical protein